MKQIIVLLVVLMTFLSGTYAQADKKGVFLFETFKDGIVRYKDGRQFRVPLNYNLVQGHFVFIDKKDNNLEKEFSEPDMVTMIEIDERIFLSPSEGATEIIQTTPPLYVSYEATVRKEKDTAYGGQTQTASVDSYSQIRGVGQIGGIDGTKKTVAAINKIYKIKIGKKMKRFSNKKQFIKLFPAQVEKISEYFTKIDADFDNTEQVLALYNFVIGQK